MTRQVGLISPEHSSVTGNLIGGTVAAFTLLTGVSSAIWSEAVQRLPETRVPQMFAQHAPELMYAAGQLLQHVVGR